MKIRDSGVVRRRRDVGIASSRQVIPAATPAGSPLGGCSPFVLVDEKASGKPGAEQRKGQFDADSRDRPRVAEPWVGCDSR